MKSKRTIIFVPLLLAGGSSFVIPPGAVSLDRLSTPVDTRVEKEILIDLLRAGEDENSPKLTPHLDLLRQSYSASKTDARYSKNPIYNGDWGNLNIPAFPGRLGFTKDGLPMYTVGRLTFNLIPPAKDVVCAVEKMVQHVHPVEPHEFPTDSQVPATLRETLKQNPRELRTNKIDTLFQIPGSSVRGILRMEGYTMPNADEENKFDTWFVGGRCLPQDGVDKEEWIMVFGSEKRAQDKLHYCLPNPMAAYQTVEYLDDELRVSVGNRGTVMIVRRE